MSNNRLPRTDFDYDQSISFWDVINKLENTSEVLRVPQQAYLQKLLALNEHRLFEMGKLIYAMLSQNIYPDTVFLNVVLRFLKEPYLSHYIPALFSIMCRKKLANSDTYNIVLYSLTKKQCSEYKKGLSILNQAVKEGFANTQTFSLTLSLLARIKNPNVNAALHLLNIAKSNGVAGPPVYDMVIKVLAKKKCEANQYKILALLEEQLKLQPVCVEVYQDAHVETKVINKGANSFGLFAKVAAGAAVAAVVATSIFCM